MTSLTATRGRLTVGVHVAVVLVVLLTLASVWLGTVRLASLPGLVPGVAAVVLVCDLLTVLMLVGLYRHGHGTRLFVLALAFLWSAAAVLLTTIAAPGGLTAVPAFPPSSGAMGWFWLSRHVVPPLIIALALVPWPSRTETRYGVALPWRTTWTVGLGTAVATLALVLWVVTGWPVRPPVVMDTATWELSPTAVVVATVVPLLAAVVAGWGTLVRRRVTDVERWALVALVAWAGDAVVVAAGADPGTVAYVSARVLALVAAAVVLGSILAEVWQAHARLVRGGADLRSTVQRLEEDARLRDHVGAVVSHDLRTPLAGLQAYLQLLVDGPPLGVEQTERMQQRSLVLTRRLALLSEDLLAATSASGAALTVDLRPLCLAEEVEETRATFPDLDVRTDVPDGLGVCADRLRLQQVLSNLVRNAERHGAEPITVSAHAAGDEVVVRVRDEGPGVPAVLVPRLFERYTQGPDARTGAGLGLSIVRELVGAMGGRVRYDRAARTFEVVLASVSAPPATRPASERVAAPTT